MQLVDAGQIALDDPVQQYLPCFRTADAQASAQIAVRHLLHHTGGFSGVEGYARNYQNDPDAGVSLEEVDGRKIVLVRC